MSYSRVSTRRHPANELLLVRYLQLLRKCNQTEREVPIKCDETLPAEAIIRVVCTQPGCLKFEKQMDENCVKVTLAARSGETQEGDLVDEFEAKQSDPGVAAYMGRTVYKTKMCVYHRPGKSVCYNGSNCSFAHDEQELRPSAHVDCWRRPKSPHSSTSVSLPS